MLPRSTISMFVKRRSRRGLSTKKAAATALGAIGGYLPVPTEELARRHSLAVLNPGRNPLRQNLQRAESVCGVPPLLGIFNDIPWHQMRESDVASWAKAGFSFVVNDGEHNGPDGRMTRELNALFLKYGITPVQRLHREALSEHGDSLAMGARGTMRPYGTTLDEARRYLRSVRFPRSVGELTTPTSPRATKDDRGGYPMRQGDREMTFTPDSLRNFETETQGWIQFETSEYIEDERVRDAVLDCMAEEGEHRTALFVGPFDAIIRGGDANAMEEAISRLFGAASDRGVVSGRVCGSGTCKEPSDIEDAMVSAIRSGARLISVHYMCSDLAYVGARVAAQPFFRACERAGF